MNIQLAEQLPRGYYPDRVEFAYMSAQSSRSPLGELFGAVMDKTQIEAMMRATGGPMTEAQLQVLRDMQAFLEYAILNGFSFRVAVGTLLLRPLFI